jgi:hypothetical protein
MLVGGGYGNVYGAGRETGFAYVHMLAWGILWECSINVLFMFYLFVLQRANDNRDKIATLERQYDEMKQRRDNVERELLDANSKLQVQREEFFAQTQQMHDLQGTYICGVCVIIYSLSFIADHQRVKSEMQTLSQRHAQLQSDHSVVVEKRVAFEKV